MIPVDMLEKHDPANGTIGDCFRCCIASILELPAAAVPHFMGGANFQDETGQWHKDLNDWLRPQGLCYMEFNVDLGDWYFPNISVYHVMSGKSPNFLGVGHSVVALNGKPVHDPAPSKKGLLGPYDDGRYCIGFIIKTGE